MRLSDGLVNNRNNLRAVTKNPRDDQDGVKEDEHEKNREQGGDGFLDTPHVEPDQKE